VSVKKSSEFSRFARKKDHIDRAKALTVPLLVRWLWIAVEKAQNAPPPPHVHRESSAPLQLNVGFPHELVRSS
jgi:hypothetical protein